MFANSLCFDCIMFMLATTVRYVMLCYTSTTITCCCIIELDVYI